jgi:hypothetical protein
MKILSGPRGSGKTTELIKQCHNNPGSYIVVRDCSTASAIHSYSIKYGYKIPFPLTYGEFINKTYSSTIPALYIDNIDMLIHMMSKCKIAMCSVQTEEIPWEDERIQKVKGEELAKIEELEKASLELDKKTKRGEVMDVWLNGKKISKKQKKAIEKWRREKYGL